MLSMPVCGVERRNAATAARLAPWRRIDAATGSTPQEHSGSGMPKKAAFHTGPNPPRPRRRSTHSGEMKIDSAPAMRKPTRR